MTSHSHNIKISRYIKHWWQSERLPSQMLRKDKVVNILPGKGSWLGEFFDPAEPEDYWEKPHVHHVTWRKGLETVSEIESSELWVDISGNSKRNAYVKDVLKFRFLQRCCWPFRPLAIRWPYLSRCPSNVSPSAVASWPSTVDPCTKPSRRAVWRKSLGCFPRFFFVCEIPRWKIWKQKTESLTLWLYDGMGTVVCVFRV